MAYTHEIEWQFSGTPLQLRDAVNTLRDRGTTFFINPSPENDGRMRIDFKVGEPLCQGWAVAQSRPMGTIISLQAMKEYQWSSLEPVWAIIVAELRRQGWKIEELNPDTANHQPVHAAATSQPPITNKVELSKLIRRHYDLGEFKSLCFELQVAYDDLPGETLTNRVEALVEYLDRRGRVQELLKLIKQQRPNAT